MDYETIVKGRRRNWDALKPDEARRREREEERARREEEAVKNPAKGMTGFQRLRARIMERAEQEDRKRFRQALRQSAILGIAFVVCLIGWVAVEQVVASRARALFTQRAEAYGTALDEQQSIFTLEDPLGAFTSWRSAWLREDYQQLVRTFSMTYLKRVQPNADLGALVAEYRRMAAAGGMDASISLALNFGNPDPVHVPRAPWSNGDLAIFQSQPIVVFGEERIYIAAMAFDGQTGTWRFADVREAPYFSIRWRKEAEILPLRMGTGARRYDQRGNEIE